MSLIHTLVELGIVGTSEDPTYYQTVLYIGDMCEPIGKEFLCYEDCRKYAEALVEGFNASGVPIRHSKIYDLM